MRLGRRGFTGGALAVAAGGLELGPIQVAQLLDLTGAFAPSSDHWRNGAEMAVLRVNGDGGLFGRLVQVTTFDSHSVPVLAHAAAERALEGSPVGMIGPAGSAGAIAALAATRATGLAHLVGGAAADLGPPHPTLFRVEPPRHDGITRLGLLIATSRPARVAIVVADQSWTNRELEVLSRALPGVALTTVSDRGDASATAAAAAHVMPDTVCLIAADETAGRLIVAIRQQMPTLKLFGEAALLQPRVLTLAGDAATGLQAVASIPFAPELGGADAFAHDYRRQYLQAPDGHAASGYVAMACLLAGIARVGRADARAAPAALRAAPVPAATALLDTSWGPSGELIRPMFIVEMRDGVQHVVGHVPAN